MILGCIYFIYTSLEGKLPYTRSFFDSWESYNKSQELEAETGDVHPQNKICFLKKKPPKSNTPPKYTQTLIIMTVSQKM